MIDTPDIGYVLYSNETLPEDRSSEMVTVDSLASDLCARGIETRLTLLVHVPISSLGWVCGGASVVKDTLQRLGGMDGPIVVCLSANASCQH